MDEKMYNFYKDNINNLNNALDLLYNDNLSKVEACKICNIKVSLLDALLRSIHDNEKKTTSRGRIPQSSWRDKFIHDVFLKDDVKVCDDFDKAYEYCLSTLYNDRERAIVRLRYEGGLSFDELGQKFKLSSGRVRQIHHNAMNRLRHPTRSKVLLYGMDYVNQMSIKRESELEVRRQEILSKQRDLLSKINGNLKPMNFANVDYSQVTLDDLKLPKRPYNALKSAKIYTLQDIVNNADRIRDNRIRGFGVKSLVELQARIEGCGVNLLSNINSIEAIDNYIKSCKH
jgi:DNA-binding CsgD family transcriptional regulator